MTAVPTPPASIASVMPVTQRSRGKRQIRRGDRMDAAKRMARKGTVSLSSGGKSGIFSHARSGRNRTAPKTANSTARFGGSAKNSATVNGNQSTSAAMETNPVGLMNADRQPITDGRPLRFGGVSARFHVQRCPQRTLRPQNGTDRLSIRR